MVKRYIGDKPHTELTIIPYDRHSWARRQQARELGINEDELPDEPDEMLDHSDSQGYDKFED